MVNFLIHTKFDKKLLAVKYKMDNQIPSII